MLRDVVSISSSLYDPNGYVSPYVLFSWLMLQRSRLGDIGWDSPLDPELRREFIKWSLSIPLLVNLKIPRWWGSGVDNVVDEQLHVFCDTAATRYGVIAYHRVRSSLGKIAITIICTRLYVVPLNLARVSHQKQYTASGVDCRGEGCQNTSLHPSSGKGEVSKVLSLDGFEIDSEYDL